MNQATPSAVARPVDARAAGEAPPGDAGGNCRRGSATGNRGRLIGLRSSGRPRWQSGRALLIGLVVGGHAATLLRERPSRPPVGAAQSAACHPRQPTPVPWHGTAQIAHLGDTRSAEWPGTISPLPQMQGRRQLCGETKVLVHRGRDGSVVYSSAAGHSATMVDRRGGCHAWPQTASGGPAR